MLAFPQPSTSCSRSLRALAPAAVALVSAVLLAACAGNPRAAAVPASSPLSLACMTCHGGPDADRNASDLRRLPPARIASDLRAFRDGTREGTVMPRLAKALDEDDIARLAQSFGSVAE